MSPDPRRRTPAAPTSWDRVAGWYDGWVGQGGSRYHQAIAIPTALELLELQSGEDLLDVGAGQGVFAPYVTERGARYTGIDASPRLIEAARRRHGRTGRFLVGDARDLQAVRGLGGQTFDAAVLLLSIQDIDPLDAVIDGLGWALRQHGRLVIVMTHPCFRQPRHSGWGFDDARKRPFRRIDSYLTPMAVPMKSIAGRPPTRSFHRPLSLYVEALGGAGFAIDAMREPPDLPPEARPGRRLATNVQGSLEIPLFLALRALRL